MFHKEYLVEYTGKNNKLRMKDIINERGRKPKREYRR